MKTTVETSPRLHRRKKERNPLQAIENINLSRAMKRLQTNLGWTQSETETAVKQYRRFLVLAALHPKQTLVPSKLVDEVWHQHVLDTQQYPKDCDKVFGAVMHHNPYFGTTPRGKRLLPGLFKQTNRLFTQEFGDNALVVDDGLAHLMEAGSSCK